MTKDEALKMAIEALLTGHHHIDLCNEAINACKEALEPEPMTTTDVITCKMAGKCCMTGEALEQPLTRDWKHTIEERIARDSEFKEALEQPAQELEAYLRSAIDNARDVCKYLDHDMVEKAKANTQFFWDDLDKIRELDNDLGKIL
jgi:hypothetical protein